MNNTVRVRFAPSPTGFMHIGGIRTALYNYLFARKNGGKFILRIEDTDKNRYVSGAEKYIIDSLDWLGLQPDEGPLQGGSAIYYRQSERTAIYQEYIQILINGGYAYYAFDTPEELEAMRARLLAAKIPSPKYNVVARDLMRNSLVLPADQVQELIQTGTPYVVRLKTLHKQDVRFHDTVRGWIKVASEELEDKVLMKSDGIPTYHFANVVDDHLMQTSHVIRGEEWIPSTPMHILLYNAFGWKDTMPEFVHLPLLLKPNGEGKLSKRDADQLGFPIFPLSWQNVDTGETTVGFREQGYLPGALLNFLSLMGWNPGNNQEVLTIDQLIDEFSLNRIGKAGAKFDINKAKWLNQQHIKLMLEDKIASEVLAGLVNVGIKSNLDAVIRICKLLKERAVFIQDIVDEAKIFFIAPTIFDKNATQQYWSRQTIDALREFAIEIKNLQYFDPISIKNLLNVIATQNGIKANKLMPALRLAISGVVSGPDLMEMICIIGKEDIITRINNAIVSIAHID